MSGPKVWSRPGSKRHLKQLRARAVFLAVQASDAAARSKRAEAAYEAAQAASAQAQDDLDAITEAYLNTVPPKGTA
jgi:hypothetical protein